MNNIDVPGGIKIIEAFPPNIEKIRKAFGTLPKKVVFAYGDIIFNPSGETIFEPMRIHELTHMAQQGNDVEKWWDMYCEDKDFRFTQELEAFSNEYNCYRTLKADRNDQNMFLHTCAERLSSSLYGADISLSEAFALIKQHADTGYSKRK